MKQKIEPPRAEAKKAEEDKKKAEADAAKDKIEQVLLTEIRDLLKAQAAK